MNPLEIKDLTGLSEPATKLIEEVSKGIGAIYEPTKIKKFALAKAEATIIEAEAKSKAAIISANTEAEIKLIDLQTSQRINYLEYRRQENINSIVEIALQQLPKEVSKEKVDEDWTVQFFNDCQDIGNDEMQNLWGRILAGEVASPGKFSLKTLEIVKTLQQKDAVLFKIICNFLWGERHIFFKNTMYDFFNKIYNFKYVDIKHLEYLGLISTDFAFTFLSNEVKSFTYHGLRYRITNLKPYKSSINCYRLSQSGFELSSLCETESKEDYLSELKLAYSKTFTIEASSPFLNRNKIKS